MPGEALAPATPVPSWRYGRGIARAYMCLSRVKHAEDLCVARPFSPQLLCQGALLGPQTLLQVHQRAVTQAQAKLLFDKESLARKRRTETLLFCRSCSCQPNKPDQLLSIREFTDSQEWRPDVWNAIVQQGMERFCKSCRGNTNPGRSTTNPELLTRARCAFCNLTPLPAPGFCTACLATELLACARCDVGQKTKRKRLDQFSPQEIYQKKHQYKKSELRRVRCLKCMAHSATLSTRTAPLGQCRNCHKAVSINTLSDYSATSRSGLCRQCQNLSRTAPPPKVCGQCGNFLRSSSTTPGTLCDACGYPPCAVCRLTPRPRNGKYHSKKLLSWTCAKCRQKPDTT